MNRSKITFALLLSLSCALRLGAEEETTDIDSLLSEYKIESSQSRISKNEAAGFVDVYTREDLEMMQATRLYDVLKLFTIPYVSRTTINTAYFSKPDNSYMPNYAIRLFIDDHDMSSGLFMNDTLMYRNISLSFVDHIVVYRSSSSVEFGNETGTVIIKMYSKDPQKEQGGLLQLKVDNKGSAEGNVFYAQTLSDDLSFTLSAGANNINRTEYTNGLYTLNSDSASQTLYANFSYKTWDFTFGHYAPKSNSFLGLGKDANPEGEGCDSRHDYIQVSKELPDDLTIRFSYDTITNNLNYKDQSGIYAGAAGFVENYNAKREEDIFSFNAEKYFYTQNNKLLIGAFAKHKRLHYSGLFDTTAADFSNRLNLFSLYAENSYSFDEETMLVLSLKGDFYRYDKDVKSQNKYIARIGFIKNIDKLQLKAFYTKTYYALPLNYLYSGGENVPYKTDANLDYPELTLKNIGALYKNGKHTIDARVTLIDVDNKTANFIQPVQREYSYNQYELKYTYQIDLKNKLIINYYTGRSDETNPTTPKEGLNLIAYNSYKKFDFYNFFNYKSPYTLYNIHVNAAYGYDFALKYHYNKDTSFGIKGENVFKSGFKQVYYNYDKAIAVYDQKFWLNLEYLF